MSPTQEPREIVKLLDLEPHPEGGYFKETFRDADTLSNGRPQSTLIYFLIEEGNFSSLHRIDAAEAWHFYAGSGAGMQVIELEDSGPRITPLGMDLEAGQRPQYVVAKDRWFGARVVRAEGSEGHGWALVGCTVVPGFVFEKFEVGKREMLLREFPACQQVVRALTRDE